MTCCLYVLFLCADELNLLSFSQSTFSVVESQGSAEVCIQSLIPVVRDSLATIVTMPETATGKPL